MRERLESAIRLRNEGGLREARKLLVELQAEFPDDPVVNYHCAWAHDLMGREREAIGFYERAIAGGLAGDDLEGALIGLGSSYRVAGEIAKAVATLESGAKLFPATRAFPVFLAMALHNAGRSADAVGILLKNLADTTSDPSLVRYRKALEFYSRSLDVRPAGEKS